jgi:hypothetical protein
MMRVFTFGAVAAIFMFCVVEASAAPPACVRGVVDPNSPVVGAWSLRQRDDDTGQWSGPWINTFRADGSFAQNNADTVGRWCVIDGNVLVFSFDGEPHTAYRATITPDLSVMRGTESWDGGNTDEFELTRR